MRTGASADEAKRDPVAWRNPARLGLRARGTCTQAECGTTGGAQLQKIPPVNRKTLSHEKKGDLVGYGCEHHAVIEHPSVITLEVNGARLRLVRRQCTTRNAHHRLIVDDLDAIEHHGEVALV